jgi:hypothetical protein
MRTTTLCALAALTLATACGPGESASNTNNDQWELNNDENNTSGTNNTTNNTTGTNNATNNTAGTNNTTGETNNVSPPTVEEQLVDEAWTGFFELDAQGAEGAGRVGVAPRVRFRADGTADLSLETTREGDWTISPTGEVVLSGLPQLDADDPETLLFEIEEEGDEVVSLKLILGVTERIVFEQVDSVVGPVTLEDIEGRWRSVEQVQNAEGDMFDLAMRFFADGFDYGGVVPNQGFVSFANLPGQVITFSDGSTFWAWTAPAGGADSQPLAGEITVDAAGEIRLWSAYFKESADPDTEGELFSVEMEAVEAF